MLHTDESWFRDEAGRTLLLRGVNLGCDTKVPTVPDGATHHSEGSSTTAWSRSWAGRFPCQRRSNTCHASNPGDWPLLRFLVTWEAIEHAGPGLYDTAYLDYLEQVVRLAGDMGFTVFVDPHQDVWSRFTGATGPRAGHWRPLAST